MVKLKNELIVEKPQVSDLLFPAVVWLGSRMVIGLAMFAIAPFLSTPEGGTAASFGWGGFAAWDALQYRDIATTGYTYDPVGKGNIAFFPLFPLLIRGLMTIGISFEIAGVLINNLAFIGFLYLLYHWLNHKYNQNIARTTLMVAVWFPTSLFATTIYTEGLYLFLSLLTIYGFENRYYGLMIPAGILATATRPTGIALIPALIMATWQQRRSIWAYGSAIAVAGGIIGFGIYCWLSFGDGLAFINAQKAWRTSLGFDYQAWWKMLMQISIGNYNWKQGFIKDFSHPLVFLVIMGLGVTLWKLRLRLGIGKVDYGFGVLMVGLWLLAGDPLINTVVVGGTAYFLWKFRQELSPATFYYGVCGIALLMASGGTWSLSRLVYGIFPSIICLGIALAKNSRWQSMTFGFFAILLVTFSIRFAQKLWVG